MKPERKARVLVIDDEEKIRKSLKMILEYEGFVFFEAGDGEEGLTKIDEIPGLDLILLDIHLPGRDGLDVLKEIPKPSIPSRSHYDLRAGDGPDGRRGDQARGVRVPGEAPSPRPDSPDPAQRSGQKQAGPGEHRPAAEAGREAV
ncbi:MAG: response regulator [Desulfobacterales bacterium]|nr:response regulator [Desulfobacterales bacterium]